MTTDIAEAVLNSRSDAIVATDRDGAVTFWNPGAERLFGFLAEEARGRPMDMIIPANLRSRHWEGFRRTMETGESRYGAGDLLSVPALAKDGRRLSIEFSIALLRDPEGLPAGTVAVIRDVTAHYEEVRALRRRVAETAGAASALGPQPVRSYSD
jgi:PAS domain S-box-containing protein